MDCLSAIPPRLASLMLRHQRSTLSAGPDQTLIYRKQGSPFARPSRRRRGPAKRLSQPSPQLPGRRRDREPRRCRREKNQSAAPPDREPDDRGEGGKPQTSKRRAQSVERRLFLGAARPLAADLRGDRRKSSSPTRTCPTTISPADRSCALRCVRTTKLSACGCPRHSWMRFAERPNAKASLPAIHPDGDRERAGEGESQVIRRA